MKIYRVRRKGAEHVTFAASENDNGEYEIARLPGGALACACMAYVFNKDVPKTCKHIGAYGAAAVSFSRHESVRRDAHGKLSPRPTITVGAETFTFRRAISFGALPTGSGI
jgi:hypothetical protein